MIKETKTIGVVFGGKSSEHEVSILSAKTIINALKTKKNKQLFQTIPIYIDKNGYWWSENIADEVLLKGKIKNKIISDNNLKKEMNLLKLPKIIEKIDVWFPVLHGPNGEDGTIQGLFQISGKPYVGSGILGSSVGMDKITMKSVFNSSGIPQCPYIAIKNFQKKENLSLNKIISKTRKNIGFPCFIKPANLGSSVGITKAYSEDELIEGLNSAAYFDSRIVIEKSIVGRELECAVIGKNDMKSSIVGEIKFKTDWYNYQAKYSEGLSDAIIPAPISKEISQRIRKLSLSACKAINAYGLARVDFFYQEKTNEIFINEINTLPGFTEKSMFPMLWKATELNLENLVAFLIETAQE